MSSSPPGAPSPRTGFLEQFRGLPWWMVVLIVLPLSLVAIGGLIGGVLGAIAALGNMYVARSRLSPSAKIAAMLGLLVAAYAVWLLLRLVVTLALLSAATG
ncbi:MAG TPA: hypothetical protein VFL27_13645 [Candidatus Dormibacteraeota bacterium]|nr:hypothetical protein [Candidatus Dormibacteraeota bacterium]